jgi:hypothetical protein
MNVATTSKITEQLHDQFLRLVPRIESHARFIFRSVRCAVRREDAMQECRALAWKWFVRLHERGKNIDEFVTHFITLVGRAVKSGRRLTGMAKAKDVMNERCQAKHGFRVQALATSTRTSRETRYSKPNGQEEQDAFEERLRDNAVTPPPDAAAFRVDFPQWRATQSERDSRLIDLLMLDTPTQDAARVFGVSPGRVSQKRRKFHDDWLRFHGEGMPGASCGADADR